jgi:VWFA-related protein
MMGQDQCLSADEIKTMVSRLDAREQRPLNKKLRDRLFKLREKNENRISEAVAGNRKSDALMDRLRESRTANANQLCPILKEFGWPTTTMVGTDGVAAAFLLFRNSSSELQIALLPVVIAAAKQEQIARPDLASYVDRLRLNAGLKQLFGTQATILDGLLVLFPIEAEAQVDARRKQFELPPLAIYLRALELRYRLPLIRSTGPLTNSYSDQARKSIDKTTSSVLVEGEPVEENEVIRVDINLVNLNVSVYGARLRTRAGMLEQKDFVISEDGQLQTITFFATTDVPFDLVLLLDLSGSTSGKRKLIRKSTQRFIEAARPTDRLAVITFAETQTVVSPLTEDRAELLERTNKIEGQGGSNVWDALKFTLDQVIGSKTLSRRRAIVFMTDGVDNALGSAQRGSRISFADLLEAVRHSDTLIVPIYLDTESSLDDFPFTKRIYQNARKTLALLAEESGGLYYQARKIEDLDGVYAQVIEDLGKVYSLGYKPANSRRDGSWRAVKVEIPSHRDLLTRTRPGYYAK